MSKVHGLPAYTPGLRVLTANAYYVITGYMDKHTSKSGYLFSLRVMSLEPYIGFHHHRSTYHSCQPKSTPSIMSSIKGSWVIVKPAKVASDPTLTGHHRDADQTQITTSQNQTLGASYAPHNQDDIRSDSKLNGKSDLTEGGNEHVGSRNRKYAERERHEGIVRQPC
jgi:hypothetical protein